MVGTLTNVRDKGSDRWYVLEAGEEEVGDL
jgi:hypothetical protein